MVSTPNVHFRVVMSVEYLSPLVVARRGMLDGLSPELGVLSRAVMLPLGVRPPAKCSTMRAIDMKSCLRVI